MADQGPDKVTFEKNVRITYVYAVLAGTQYFVFGQGQRVIVLIGVLKQERRSCMDLIGKVLLSTRRKVRLKLLVFSKVV